MWVDAAPGNPQRSTAWMSKRLFDEQREGRLGVLASASRTNNGLSSGVFA